MKQQIIRLWSACNQKCLFCNQEEKVDKKSKKYILLELLNFKRNWVQRLVISWWEPTIFRDELFFTIEIWKKIWFKDIEIQSNAVLLENYDYVKQLYDLWLNSAMISFHHFEESISDELTQAIWTFKKTLIWINNLLNIGIRTTLNIVLNKNNYKYLLEYLVYIKNNFKWFNSISLSVVVPWKLTLYNDLLPNYTDLSKYLIKWYDYCLKNNIYFQNPWCWVPICFIKDYYEYSLEYQNLSNNIKNDEFILQKNSINKVKSSSCRECLFDNYCLWLWKWYVDKYWFDWLKPILELY